MPYKPGAKVRVKSWEKMKEEYICSWTNEMFEPNYNIKLV